MKQGADWYKREPLAYLGSVQGMSSKHHAVFSVVLDLIYVHGGAINNDAGWIAGWISDMGAASVRRVIQDLVDKEKLEIDGDQITEIRAKTEAKTKKELRETNANSGRIGGINSGKSRRGSNNNNDLDKASGSSEKQADKIREDNTPFTPPDGAVQATLFGDQDQAGKPPVPQPDPKPPKRKTVFPSDWRPAEPLRDWARQRGHTDAKISALADACVNHHVAKGTLFQDLNAAFRTWVINDDRFAKPAAIGQPAPSSPHLSDAMQRRMAQRYGGGQQ